MNSRQVEMGKRGLGEGVQMEVTPGDGEVGVEI